MVARKLLPLAEWPQADHDAFRAAYRPGDVFDDTAGPGAHLAEKTRENIQNAYRRWLGFLKVTYPRELALPPAARIRPDTVRVFAEALCADVRPTTLHTIIGGLHFAARLIAPGEDWSWLKAIKARLAAQAVPRDRCDRLVRPVETFDFGLTLMDMADDLERTDHCARELQYRDGLIIALVSLWPIRRRSLAAITVSHHLEINEDAITILLHREDTKSRRAESFRVPATLLPYLERYLKDVRPRLIGDGDCGALWPSYRHHPLTALWIATMVRRRILARFGKAMALHDFRRAAATSLATDAPDLVGLIPGVLQHASPEVGEQYYNLARSAEASRRYNELIRQYRAALRRRVREPIG